MDIEQAIVYALDGEAVLFLGSGFSMGAIKADTHPFKGAKDLAHDLQRECGIAEEEMVSDLGQASEVFQELKSEHELVDYLIKEFTAIEITPSQKIIGSVNWKRIYTTNYDNVIKLAYEKNKRLLKSTTLSQKLSTFKDKSNLCVYLNGRIDGLSIEKLNNEFKLTNMSYLTEIFRKSEWLSLFRTDLLTAKAIFFVGYSMRYDLDIQRLVSSLDNIKEKTFFITSENSTKIADKIYIKKYGNVIPIGADQFSSRIECVKKMHTPSPVKSINYLCFRCHPKMQEPKSIKDSDVFNFLTQGEFDSTNVYYSTISPTDYKYCIFRTKLPNVCDSIDSGVKNCLIHASLGNGKSVFIDALSSWLTARGYNVYRYYRYVATFASEVEAICREHDKTVLVFEDYSSCLGELDTVRQFRTDQILVLSERSFVNEANYDTIYSKFGDFSCVDIDQLDDDEVNALADLLAEYGFWTIIQRSNKSTSFIMENCHSCLRNVVLQILNSPDIVSRFKKITNVIKNKSGYYEAIIFLLIASISKIRLGIEDLAGAVDIDHINSPRFKSDPVVREFVDFENSRIKSKSSLLSQSLLSQVFNTEIVVDTMIKIMQNIEGYGDRKVAKDIARRLMTFTNIQNILNEKDPSFKGNLLRYYEAVKSMKYCRCNPHFWLQYAIVMLSERNYDRAKYYFDTAYRYGDNMDGFDTYQIDNHYARWILSNELQSGSPSTCMEAFKHAHAILMDPKHKLEVRFYPYKVAGLYHSFYEKFFRSMKRHEKKEFLASCQSMLNRLEWYVSYSREGGKRKEVANAKKGIQQILKEENVQTHHVDSE